jgi:hypothetical protein
MSKNHLYASRRGGSGTSGGNPEGIDDQAFTVGYKQPPLHTRFQPGSSGNPKGRPKVLKCRNVKDEIQQVYLREIAVRDGNTTRHVSGIVLLIHRLLNDALKGDRRAALASYRLAAELGVLNIKDKFELDLSQLTPAEREQCSKTLEILRRARVLSRFAGGD